MSQPITQEHVSADLLSAALGYAGRGWRVLPLHTPDLKQKSGCSCQGPRCKARGKHPRTRNGVKDATTVEAQIREWWATWPNANIGVATGDGLLVLDVDPRNGGGESLAELERQHGQLRTMRVRTGSGGLHLYFRVSGSFRSRTDLRPGLDIKADGGYVVAPPSLHIEGCYKLADGSDVGRVPPWLLGLLESVSGGAATGLTPAQLADYAAPSDDPEDRIRWTRMAVKRIPNDSRFDDRNKWIGMAHAIRASCGVDMEEEAFEIFDEFSQRWTGGYDADATRRVWDTLPSSRNPGGHWLLKSLAYRDDHWAMPDDHPWRADNEFAAYVEPIPTDLRTALASIHQPGLDWVDLLSYMERVGRAVVRLESRDRLIVESAALKRIKDLMGSWSRAEELFRRPAPASEQSPFSRDDTGELVLRPLQAADALPVRRYLVAGRIPAASVGALVSGFSVGKTWLIVDLGLSVAFGRPWLGCETTESPVIFMIAEGNDDFLTRVFGWLVEHRYLDDSATLPDLFQVLDRRVLINKYRAQFDDSDFERGLIGTINRTGAGAVFVDTLGKTLGRDQPENDNDVANEITGMLSDIAARTGCTAIFTHHVGVADNTRARGASAWEQGLDFEYVLKGTAEDLDRGDPITLKARKMRNAPLPSPLAFRLKRLPGLSLSDVSCAEPRMVSSGVIELAKSPTAGSSAEARVYQYIEQNPGCSKGGVSSQVFGGSNKVRGAIVELEQRGAIENRGTDNRHKWHAVGGWCVDGSGSVVNLAEEFPSLAPSDQTEGES